jgi:hypothetical protein
LQPTLYTPRQIARQGYVIENVEVVQRVDGFTPCWEWSGARDDRDYGTASGGGKDGSHNKAYRTSYMAFVGTIPPRLHTDHLCYNHCCVNPDHLEVVTPRENILRSVAHHKALGTGNWNVYSMCGKGLHEMTDDNIYNVFTGGRNHRHCRTCLLARQRQTARDNPERYAQYQITRNAKNRAKTAARQAARAAAA